MPTNPAWTPSTAVTATGNRSRKPAQQAPVAATAPPQKPVAGPEPAASPRVRAPEAGSRGPEPDTTWHAAYIEALEKNGGQKVAAAKAAGVDMRTVQRHRQSHAAFEQEEKEVLSLDLQVAESEAKRRAIDGVESIYRRTEKNKDGTETVHEHVERKYSDTVLLRLLTRLETGTWRDSKLVESHGSLTFKTRSERKAALEQARAALQPQPPVTAINGRS